MKRIFSVFLLCALTLLSPLSANATSARLNWYCTRQKDHKQMIAGPELRFVEEYNGYYIDHKHDEKNEEKVVYLTFDAGYENGNVEKILDTLKKKEAVGAFFVLEHFVRANHDLARRINNEGHLLCNHTARHSDLAQADSAAIHAEIKGLEQACCELDLTLSPYFRPPEGSFSKEMMQCVMGLGYKTVFWSFAYADWDNAKQPTVEKAYRCIMDNVHNGAVLLLHPTSATNAEVLPRVIDDLRAEGYRFGSLEELCAT